MTTCVLFREKKKEDIRQRRRRGRRATDALDRRGPAGDNWGEGEDYRGRSGYLSNNRSHVAPFTHSHPVRSIGTSSCSLMWVNALDAVPRRLMCSRSPFRPLSSTSSDLV